MTARQPFLPYNVIRKSFVEALVDGIVCLSAAKLFGGQQVVFFCVKHHPSANDFIVVVVIRLKK